MTQQTGKTSISPRKIGYDNRSGEYQGVPPQFFGLITAFPDRVYGTWWYVYDNGVRGPIEGWFIWLESIGLIGATREDRIAWCDTDTLEIGLASAANKLRT